MFNKINRKEKIRDAKV